MSDARETITIFYKLKLKRTREPIEVFEKMAKAVKKRGATKNWSCSFDEKAFIVDFGDDKSESFTVQFDDKKVCDHFCKVYFPLSGELFDDEKKSEFKALINMIYSVRTSFSEMTITDDYGIAESFLDSKVNKITMRELSDEEIERAKRLFDSGHTSVKEFITALMFDLRDLPYSDDFIPFINCHIGQQMVNTWRPDNELFFYYAAFVESFLFETTEYKNQDRLYNIPEYYNDLNSVFFSVGAFWEGILELIGMHSLYAIDPKTSQVKRFYDNKYLPAANLLTDDYEKCLLAYRFFMSVLEYLNFRYLGISKENIDYISDELVSAVKNILKSYDRKNYDIFLKAIENEIKRV